MDLYRWLAAVKEICVPGMCGGVGGGGSWMRSRSGRHHRPNVSGGRGNRVRVWIVARTPDLNRWKCVSVLEYHLLLAY